MDRLVAATGKAVGFLNDTGHLAFAVADVLRVLDGHESRINHAHAKNVRSFAADGLDREHESFLDAVLKGICTVPDDGMVEFDAAAARLAGIGYKGWFVVEAEQDPAKAPPLGYARIGFAALSGALTAAGYDIREGRP